MSPLCIGACFHTTGKHARPLMSQLHEKQPEVAWKSPNNDEIWVLKVSHLWTFNLKTSSVFNKMDLVGIVTKATKLFLDVNTISVDNWAFKLFDKATVVIIVSCSVVVTSRQFFGSPIYCDAGAVSLLLISFHTFNIFLMFLTFVIQK